MLIIGCSVVSRQAESMPTPPIDNRVDMEIRRWRPSQRGGRPTSRSHGRARARPRLTCGRAQSDLLRQAWVAQPLAAAVDAVPRSRSTSAAPEPLQVIGSATLPDCTVAAPIQVWNPPIHDLSSVWGRGRTQSPGDSDRQGGDASFRARERTVLVVLVYRAVRPVGLSPISGRSPRSR